MWRGDDGECGQFGETGEELLPPWRMVMAAWAGEVCNDSLDMNLQIIGAEEPENGGEMGGVDDEMLEEVRLSELPKAPGECGRLL